MMHRVIEENGHAVRIAEEECDIVVIRDQRICVGDTVRIVPRTAARIAAKNAYDLRPMHLSRRADPLCREPQRRAVPPAVLPHSRGIILHVQCHVQRIIRGSTDAALPCREPMHECVARKEIEPPAPQIVAEMPQYKAHTVILSAGLQTPQRRQPSKQIGVGRSAFARSYSCHR